MINKYYKLDNRGDYKTDGGWDEKRVESEVCHTDSYIIDGKYRLTISPGKTTDVTLEDITKDNIDGTLIDWKRQPKYSKKQRYRTDHWCNTQFYWSTEKN